MLKRELVRGIVISNTCVKLYRNWIINEVARAGEHTNERTYVRTYSHTYVRDRPYIPSTTLLCEGIITMNNNAPHLKSPKNRNRRAALGRPAIKITGGLQLVCGRPTLALSSALVPQTFSCLVFVEDS